MLGEYESMVAIHAVQPNFVPRPITWGSYESHKDTHFFLCDFHEMKEGLPDPNSLAAELAELHKNGKSPNGRYGFHVTTFNGDLPQDNSWSDTWEEFFRRGYKHILKLESEAQGHSNELEYISRDVLEKVIPRLLRPLESGPVKITPSLVHGDLWCGNTATDAATGKAIAFDACTFYAHNECTLVS